jgi:aldehyde:ferredoxin oxidoreductase
METYDAEDMVNQRFGRPEYRKKGAVVIGPAGENLVSFALIENDHWRSAGRTGLGAVMGSKRIKAILFQGNHERLHFDEQGVKEYAKTFLKTFRGHGATNAYRTLGTPMLVKMTNTVCAFPTQY